MISKLLIGYDGSECSDGAIVELARAGLPQQGEAVVAAVADVWPHLPPESYRQLGAQEQAQLPPMSRRALRGFIVADEQQQPVAHGDLRPRRR